MKDLYNLRNMLVSELMEHGRKDELDERSLGIIDTLAHACKNVGKVIIMLENEDGEPHGQKVRGWNNDSKKAVSQLESIISGTHDDKVKEIIQETIRLVESR